MKAFYDSTHPATSKIELTRSFAISAHGDQTYGQSLPYEKHLTDVVACLERFGFTPSIARDDRMIEDIICAGWLHDILEDTPTTQAQIAAQFGDAVAEIVARLTDEPGATREERKLKTYPKIKGHFAATVVKLADRIANVEASLAGNPAQFRKYAMEQQKFRAMTFVPVLAEPMWNHLRLLTESEYGSKPKPEDRVQLFFHKDADIEIHVDAKFENGNLRIDDVAFGDRVKNLNAGDDDYECVLTVKKEFKDALLLALLRHKFWGNSAFSQLRSWLSDRGIPYETWSG